MTMCIFSSAHHLRGKRKVIEGQNRPYLVRLLYVFCPALYNIQNVKFETKKTDSSGFGGFKRPGVSIKKNKTWVKHQVKPKIKHKVKQWAKQSIKHEAKHGHKKSPGRLSRSGGSAGGIENHKKEIG